MAVVLMEQSLFSTVTLHDACGPGGSVSDNLTLITLRPGRIDPSWAEQPDSHILVGGGEH